jgi:hypothetical protein
VRRFLCVCAERRAGGVHLADDDHNDIGGKKRYKSATQRDREEYEESQRELVHSSESFSDREKERAKSQYLKYGPNDPRGTPEERRAVEASREDFARHMMSDEPLPTGPRREMSWDARLEARSDNPNRPQFAQHQMEREPLREGEQSWRERTLARAGIPQQSDYKAVKTAEILAREAAGDPSIKSSANPRNPVLIRTRAHLNPADLPPSFDHMHVPPLSANEIDAKEKALHATYWSKYDAWRKARPQEYEKWLKRLEKRKSEQDYHFEQAQIRARGKKTPKGEKQVEKAIEALHQEAVSQMLPSAETRSNFNEAVAADPAMQQAVSTLGQEEVLRRWSAFQVFLDAETSSDNRFARFEYYRKKKIAKELALSVEDPIATLNDPVLNLNLPQRKRIYNTLLKAQIKVERAPFWTDPDPRREGEFDWKMADAFIKPPLLPPRSHMRAYSTRTDLESNFSSIHRFLHLERLRQTIGFLREWKKKVAREKVRASRDLEEHFQSLLASKPKQWEHILATYPFLSDALLSGMQSLYLAPWAQKDQQDFLTALHRQTLLIAKLLGTALAHAHVSLHVSALCCVSSYCCPACMNSCVPRPDSHFSRRNRNASWILSYPRVPRENPDEILRGMSTRDVRRMEAKLMGDELMRALEQQPQLVDELEAAVEANEARDAQEQLNAAAAEEAQAEATKTE